MKSLSIACDANFVVSKEMNSPFCPYCATVRTNRKLTNKMQQQGATLLTALIFLIILSALGVNIAQVSSLEEHMSGNTRNRDLAYQAAEATLEHVEHNLSIGENIRALNFSGASAGLETFNACLPNSADYWNGTGAIDCTNTTRSFTWSTTTAREPGQSLTQVAAKPKYVVEKLPNVGLSERYRATVRAVGGDANAVVILQAIFSYTPGP